MAMLRHRQREQHPTARTARRTGILSPEEPLAGIVISACPDSSAVAVKPIAGFGQPESE
jgi:hypothetical protein